MGALSSRPVHRSAGPCHPGGASGHTLASHTLAQRAHDPLDTGDAVWQAEWARAAAGAEGLDKPASVVKAEGDKLAADWVLECKSKLVGNPSARKDMRCLLETKTIADIRKCSEL